MNKSSFCERCWNLHHVRTEATWEVGGDFYCDNCKKQSGYELTDGCRIGSKTHKQEHPEALRPGDEVQMRQAPPSDPLGKKLSEVFPESGKAKVVATVRTRKSVIRRGVEEPMPTKTDAPPNGSKATFAQIKVPEASLDAWWQRMTIEEKGEAFSHWIERGIFPVPGHGA